MVLDEILGELLERTHNFLSTAVTNGSHGTVQYQNNLCKKKCHAPK